MKGKTTEIELQKAYEELELAKSPSAIKKNSAKHSVKIIGDVVFVVLMIIIFACLLFIQSTKEKGESPEIFGYSLYYIETGSMEPTLPVGTIIISKAVKDKDSLNKGDVVTFYWDDTKTTIVTHRIIEVVTTADGSVAYHTKGDNSKNSVDPTLLTQDRILSVMVRKLY